MKSSKQVLAFALVLLSFQGFAGEISSKATDIFVRVDALDVEHKWRAGVHIDWETGVPDNIPESSHGKHTHCSAFAAEVAKILGVYLLRPPEHGQELLANAQADWLASSEAQGMGWTRLANQLSAQNSANAGNLVLAVYKNHSLDKPGHIAIVRPSIKTEAAIIADGPQITQAGGHNFTSTTVRQGFADHPTAFLGEIQYYEHSVVWPIPK